MNYQNFAGKKIKVVKMTEFQVCVLVVFWTTIGGMVGWLIGIN